MYGELLEPNRCQFDLIIDSDNIISMYIFDLDNLHNDDVRSINHPDFNRIWENIMENSFITDYFSSIEEAEKWCLSIGMVKGEIKNKIDDTDYDENNRHFRIYIKRQEDLPFKKNTLLKSILIVLDEEKNEFKNIFIKYTVLGELNIINKEGLLFYYGFLNKNQLKNILTSLNYTVVDKDENIEKFIINNKDFIESKFNEINEEQNKEKEEQREKKLQNIKESTRIKNLIEDYKLEYELYLSKEEYEKVQEVKDKIQLLVQQLKKLSE